MAVPIATAQAPEANFLEAAPFFSSVCFVRIPIHTKLSSKVQSELDSGKLVGQRLTSLGPMPDIDASSFEGCRSNSCG